MTDSKKFCLLQAKYALVNLKRELSYKDEDFEFELGRMISSINDLLGETE